MRFRFMLIETTTFDFADEFEVVLCVWFASTGRHSGIKVLLAVISVQRVPEPDPLPGISFDTRPDPIQF